MRIGIFTQWYEPEPGPSMTISVAARELAARGHHVEVLTGFPNYPTGVIAGGYRQVPLLREDLGGVHVTRVPLLPSHDRSAVRRIGNYASFGVSAAVLGVPMLAPIDALWLAYSPITMAWPMWMQQVAHGTPTVCFVGDLWPDTIGVSGLDGAGAVVRLGGSLLHHWCEAIYASSDAVAYISPSVGEILAARGVPRSRLHYTPWPADESIFHPGGASLREEFGVDDDAVVLLYAGCMGAAQGLHSLIDAVARVDDPRLVVLLAGSGTCEEELRRRASGVRAVRFIGRLPQERMTDLLATADLAYVSLSDHPLSRATMPSKTQSTLAAGRPILAAAEGDLARLVESRRIGFVTHAGDPTSIAQGIAAALARGRKGLAALGSRAREVYVDEFSVDRAARRMEELLMDIAPRRRGVLGQRPHTRRPAGGGAADVSGG